MGHRSALAAVMEADLVLYIPEKLGNLLL